MTSELSNSKNEKKIMALFYKYYWSIILIIFLLIFFISIIAFITIDSKSNPFWYELSRNMITLSIAMLAANSMQYIRDKLLTKTINESIAADIATEVKKTVIGEFKKIRGMVHGFVPDALYYSKEQNLLDDQLKCFSNSETIRFMSTSAINLLDVTIPKLSKNVEIAIKLLLQNPTNSNMIEIRSDQLKPFEANKEPGNLKNEILKSIIKSHQLCINKPNISVCIRLHDEIPFCRIEYADNNLYLSFYQSQSKEHLGPVAQFKRDRDIYKAYFYYYNQVWDKNCQKEIDIKKYRNIHSLKSHLIAIMPDLSSEIEKLCHDRFLL